jgi:CIC family chloride channel protein
MQETQLPTKSKPSQWFGRWIARIRQREDQVFMVLTLIIGALVGLAVVAFIVLTERFGARLYPVGGAAWRRLLVPVIGALVTGYLLYRYAPDARGSGVPQTKAALFARGGRITLGTVLGKFFFTSATLASGIPLGREGPSVQVGAGLASVIGRRLGLSQEKVKSLIPVGGSAAVAAAFNAPLAAVLFTLEELVGDLHAPVLGSVVLSAATSWMVMRLFLGNEPLFHVPQYQFVHPVEFVFYGVLGVLGGIVSLVFVKSLLNMRAWFLKLPRWSVWFQPVAGGLLVGILGWFVPQVLGVGYAFVGDALNGKMALELMALLVVLKLAAVVTSYASGSAGGIFGPSLFIGAMTGGALGSVVHTLFPHHTASPGAYALVGMGAAFAGIVRAPMTSVIMIFEVTHDYAVIVPLMIANLVSFYISREFQREPIYDVLAMQDGIHLPGAETRIAAARFRVSHAMRPPKEVMQSKETIAQALERARNSEFHGWPVVDERGIVGVISLTALQRANSEGTGEKLLDQALDNKPFPHVHDDQSLELALQRLGQSGMDVIPVVSRANVRELVGIVTLGDILKRYGVASESPVIRK